MKRNYFNSSSEIRQYAYIGSTTDGIFLEQNEHFLNEGHTSYTPGFYAHDIHSRNATHSDDPYVKFKCFVYNSRNPWEESYPVNFYNGTTKLNLVKRGTAFVDIVPHKYLTAGNYYVYKGATANLGSQSPANDKYEYKYYEIYSSSTKTSANLIGGFYAESNRVCIVMQAGGGGGGAPTSGTDGAAGGGGGCAVFMLNLGLLQNSSAACIYFSIGTGGSRSGGGWGAKGSAGGNSYCYYFPTGPNGGASAVTIAYAYGGKGGGNNSAGAGEYGYLDAGALSSNYCWKMPGISYDSSNSNRHCKGGNGGTMAHAGGATNYTAYLQYLPSSGYSSLSYSLAGTGGTSKSNAGGGGGAGAYPESKGGNGGATDWATGAAGTLGGGGGGARYQWGDGGKGGNGGAGALIISEACTPPVCGYDSDNTPDISVYNPNSLEATIWVGSSSADTVSATSSRWQSVSNFERYYNIRLVCGGIFSSQTINAYSGTLGDD